MAGPTEPHSIALRGLHSAATCTNIVRDLLQRAVAGMTEMARYSSKPQPDVPPVEDGPLFFVKAKHVKCGAGRWPGEDGGNMSWNDSFGDPRTPTIGFRFSDSLMSDVYANAALLMNTAAFISALEQRNRPATAFGGKHIKTGLPVFFGYSNGLVEGLKPPTLRALTMDVWLFHNPYAAAIDAVNEELAASPTPVKWWQAYDTLRDRWASLDNVTSMAGTMIRDTRLISLACLSTTLPIGEHTVELMELRPWQAALLLTCRLNYGCETYADASAGCLQYAELVGWQDDESRFACMTPQYLRMGHMRSTYDGYDTGPGASFMEAAIREYFTVLVGALKGTVRLQGAAERDEPYLKAATKGFIGSKQEVWRYQTSLISISATFKQIKQVLSSLGYSTTEKMIAVLEHALASDMPRWRPVVLSQGDHLVFPAATTLVRFSPPLTEEVALLPDKDKAEEEEGTSPTAAHTHAQTALPPPPPPAAHDGAVLLSIAQCSSREGGERGVLPAATVRDMYRAYDDPSFRNDDDDSVCFRTAALEQFMLRQGCFGASDVKADAVAGEVDCPNGTLLRKWLPSPTIVQLLREGVVVPPGGLPLPTIAPRPTSPYSQDTAPTPVPVSVPATSAAAVALQAKGASDSSASKATAASDSAGTTTAAAARQYVHVDLTGETPGCSATHPSSGIGSRPSGSSGARAATGVSPLEAAPKRGRPPQRHDHDHDHDSTGVTVAGAQVEAASSGAHPAPLPASAAASSSKRARAGSPSQFVQDGSS